MPFRHIHHSGGIILAAVAAIAILAVLFSGRRSRGAGGVLTVLAIVFGAVFVAFLFRRL